MKVYADSNFLTRYYLDLEDLPIDSLLWKRMARLEEAFPIFWLHAFEVVNAFELHVFVARSGAGVRVTSEVAAAAQARFAEDMESGAGLVREVPLAPRILQRRFQELSLRHTASHGFRTYDLLHVSAALHLECDAVWSFDKRCTALAKREGLGTLNLP